MRFLEKVLAMTYLAMCRIFLHIISQHHLAEANPASTPETNKPEQTVFFFFLPSPEWALAGFVLAPRDSGKTTVPHHEVEQVWFTMLKMKFLHNTKRYKHLQAQKSHHRQYTTYDNSVYVRGKQSHATKRTLPSVTPTNAHTHIVTHSVLHCHV